MFRKYIVYMLGGTFRKPQKDFVGRRRRGDWQDPQTAFREIGRCSQPRMAPSPRTRLRARVAESSCTGWALYAQVTWRGPDEIYATRARVRPQMHVRRSARSFDVM